MRHVFFAAPDHLHRRAGKLLGDIRSLADEVLIATATTKTTSEHMLVDLALRQRQARLLGQGRQ